MALTTPPDEAALYAALAEDLQRLVAKYRPALPATFVGAAVCLADYGVGTLAVASQDDSQPLDAAVSMAIALLRTTLSVESDPQVATLVSRAQRLLHTAITLKTGQALATDSLH
jgi:hypothetical protein